MKQHQFITGLVLSVLILVLAGCIKLVPVQTPEPSQPLSLIHISEPTRPY